MKRTTIQKRVFDVDAKEDDDDETDGVVNADKIDGAWKKKIIVKRKNKMKI